MKLNLKRNLLWLNLSWLVLILMLPLSLAAAQGARAPDVTLTVDNRGASAFYLSAATSPGIAELGADNVAWTLRVGQRYRVINEGGAAYHPFELRAGDEALLSQLETTVGRLEVYADIAFQSDEAGITFTLTPALAEVLTSYNCAYHAAMTGLISSAQP